MDVINCYCVKTKIIKDGLFIIKKGKEYRVSAPKDGYVTVFTNKGWIHSVEVGCFDIKNEHRSKYAKKEKEKEKKEPEAYDYLGNLLHVGDSVVFMEINYRNFKKGKIISISAKKVSIFDESRYDNKSSQFHKQVIKI